MTIHICNVLAAPLRYFLCRYHQMHFGSQHAHSRDIRYDRQNIFKYDVWLCLALRHFFWRYFRLQFQSYHVYSDIQDITLQIYNVFDATVLSAEVFSNAFLISRRNSRYMRYDNINKWCVWRYGAFSGRIVTSIFALHIYIYIYIYIYGSCPFTPVSCHMQLRVGGNFCGWLGLYGPGTAQLSSGEHLGPVRLCVFIPWLCAAWLTSTMARTCWARAQMDYTLGRLCYRKQPTCSVYHILLPSALHHSNAFYRKGMHHCITFASKLALVENYISNSLGRAMPSSSLRGLARTGWPQLWAWAWRRVRLSWCRPLARLGSHL